MKTTLHILISLFLPSFFLLISCSSVSQTHLQTQCLDDQRSALLQLHHGLYYSPNFTFSSKAKLWNLNETDCCSWKGVTCDALGHVIGLDLSSKKLSGNFHSIFNLLHLQQLNLAGNNFNTTLFSYGFGKLPNLTHLNLSSSCFHGQFPMEISYLTRLVSLDLSNQDSCYRRYYQIFDPFHYVYLSYDLPSELQQPLKLENPNFKILIKNLRPLIELYLDKVNISSQSSKWCESISSALPNLRVLSMSDCGLKGPFCSSLLRLPFLSKLFLGDNLISYLPPNFLEVSSRLVSLSLRNCNLSGQFPTEILLLPKLQSIDISYNNNLMGQLPEFSINNTLRLTDLTLSNCSFSGAIPSSIANLTSLVNLDLSYNSFSGLIPQFHRYGVPNLASLDLIGNMLSGSIHSSLFTLPSLHTLLLARNQLVGEIGEFPNASSSLIEFLCLRSNYMRGSIPKSILQLPRLVRLYVGDNNFDSLKLDMFFQLKNIRVLDLSNISLSIENHNKSLVFHQLDGLYLDSCNLTEFPSFLKSLESLIVLSLSNNNISGAIPNWVLKKRLRMLRLSNNFLSSLDQFLPNQYLTSSQGSFERPISNLSKLMWLDASYNKLSGPIPSFLGNITTLEYLDLGNNTIHDTFPQWLGKLPTLKVLVLQGNRFYGPIKVSENSFSALDVLDIASNNFSGQLSVEFFQGTQLRSLKIGGNKLEGRLPRSLANCTKLEVLDLGNNMIHDTFPFWLEKLPSLKVLILSGNGFYGTIKFSEDENSFPMVRILNLAFNNFSGELSVAFFQSLRAMMMITDENKAKPNYIGDDYYQDSVTIVNKGFEIFYRKILTIFACLDLSNNNFHGIIPEEIGNLTSLRDLNLSHNSFSGQIPLALENLKELESLDLSQNKLSGKIPPQLARLTFLEALNLSYNQLEDIIPQSNQFMTFSNDSYRGNPRLCGPPLPRKCNEVVTRKPPPKEEVDSLLDGFADWSIVLIGYGCGLVIGLCIGYTVLNELGNKLLDSFTFNGNRKRRRST